MKAVISSDLHYTADKNGADLILPLIRCCGEAVSSLIRQVISIGPDVLVLTGDHTASGRKKDMESLVSYLKLLPENGIEIIMTTGNHDFDRSSRQEYMAIYGPLLKADDKDTDSLSYAKRIRNILFLSMDDHCGRIEGRFTKKTLSWLESCLITAEREKLIPVFLSHHNIFRDAWTGNSRFYQIQNPELIPLLRKHDVRLAFTGHQHFPAARRREGITEIIVPMPFQGEYAFGLLTADESDFVYRTEKIDFSRFGPDQFYAEAESRKIRARDFMANAILDTKQETDPRSVKEIRRLLSEWLVMMHSGTLTKERNKIITDPCYPALLKHTESTAYGSWIRELTEEDSLSSDCVFIPF